MIVMAMTTQVGYLAQSMGSKAITSKLKFKCGIEVNLVRLGKGEHLRRRSNVREGLRKISRISPRRLDVEQHEEAGEKRGGGRRPDPADLRGVDGMRLS